MFLFRKSNFEGGMQRDNNYGPPRGNNNSNYGGQQQSNSYNQAFPPLGTPGGNR